MNNIVAAIIANGIINGGAARRDADRQIAAMREENEKLLAAINASKPPPAPVEYGQLLPSRIAIMKKSNAEEMRRINEENLRVRRAEREAELQAAAAAKYTVDAGIIVAVCVGAIMLGVLLWLCLCGSSVQ